MSNLDKAALVVGVVTLVLPGMVIAVKHGPRPGLRGSALLGGLLAAALVGGVLFILPQMAIGALFQRVEFKDMMRLAFPEDFFWGQLRLPIDAAILNCAIMPLAFAVTWSLGLPRWLGQLALPLFLALAYLALAYHDAQSHATAPLILRMTIEAATAAAALLVWESYFLLMGWLARTLRPDLPGR